MEELISGLKRKDNEAFKKVMFMYKTQIFNYLNLMLGDRHIAEELTQDTFVKVYFKAGTLKTENLKAWIYTIATNLARSEFRKRKFKQILSLDAVNDCHVSTETNMEDKIALEQMLASLPEKNRTPLIMKEIQNFTFEEIAAILNKPVGTVKSLVFRGHEQLKNKFSVNYGGNYG